MRLLPLLLLCSAVYGNTIVSNTSQTNAIGPDEWGQAFTTPSGSAWDNITFNFFADSPAVTPEAGGTAWIYSQAPNPPWLQLIEDNFETHILGETSTIVDGKYVFSPSLVLQPNTEYWVFEDAPLPITGSYLPSAPGQETWMTHYIGPPGVAAFNILWQADFSVQGDPVGTPEPQPIALVTLGIFLLALSRYKVRRS